MEPLILDYSAYKAWAFCPWNWYELYKNLVCKVNPYQRKDNMALGSLVHGGLEQWHKTGVPEVPASVVEKIGPTPETLAIAQQIVAEYVQRYPTEPWQATAFEKPLLREYGWGTLLAKLDAYTIIPELMHVPDGVGGVLVLNPGLYGIEHKTKDENIDAAKYRKSWLVNMQANFQMLALQGQTQEHYGNFDEYRLPHLVQGIIINIIDKPRPYMPKSKCKSCQVTNELSFWIPANEGKWSCRECGNVQFIKPRGPQVERKFEFWRMLVTRTETQLHVAEREIELTAIAMNAMIDGDGLMDNIEIPNRVNCIHPITYHECQFFEPHLQGFNTVGHPSYVQVEDYRGL